MKILKCLLLSTLFFVGGCSASKPYQIISETTAPAHTVFFVEAPKGASEAQMTEWSKELETQAGRETMVNFYNGGRGAQNMIGSYQGGTLYKTR